MEKKNWYIFGVLLIGIILIGVVLTNKMSVPVKAPSQPLAEAVTEDNSKNSITAAAVADTKAQSDDALEIPITIKDFKFNPSVVNAKKGQKVRFVVTAEDRNYGFSIAEFYIKEELRLGETKTVEFTPDKYGTFIIFSRKEWNNGKIDQLGRLVVTLN